MSKKIQLSAGEHTCLGSFDELSHGEEHSDYLERPALLVYAGEFESMDGPVEVSDEHLDRLVSNHNSMFSKVKRLATGEVPARFMPPLQLDHSRSAAVTVGRVPGELSIGTYKDPTDGKEKKAVYGRVRILGKENVEKVKDGRYTHLSIGADLEEGKLNELSITPFPAAAMASILSKAKVNTLGGNMAVSDKNKAEDKHYDMAKFKKHLMDEKKMAEKDADDHMAKMADEDKDKLASEIKDHEEKMAKGASEKQEADEKEHKEEVKKMAAAKEKFTQLTKDFKAGVSGVELQVKQGKIQARLSKLKASAKITPAEIKKIDLKKLSASNQETIDAVLKSYEDREQVVVTGILGTTQAVNLAALAAKAKLAQAEQETLSNMPFTKGARLGAGVDTMPKQKSEMAEKMPAQDSTPQMTGEPGEMPHMAHLEDIVKHMEIGEHEAAYAKMKALVEKAKVGDPGADVNPEESEKQMSALAESLQTLQNKFNEVVELSAPLMGINLSEIGVAK